MASVGFFFGHLSCLLSIGDQDRTAVFGRRRRLVVPMISGCRYFSFLFFCVWFFVGVFLWFSTDDGETVRRRPNFPGSVVVVVVVFFFLARHRINDLVSRPPING